MPLLVVFKRFVVYFSSLPIILFIIGALHVDLCCKKHDYLQVRDELEHLLDDDEDMAEMYLTDKLVQQQLESSSASSINDDEDDMDNQPLQPDIDDRHEHHFFFFLCSYLLPD